MDISKPIIIATQKFANELPEQQCRQLVGATLALYALLNIIATQTELTAKDQTRLAVLEDLLDMSGIKTIVIPS